MTHAPWLAGLSALMTVSLLVPIVRYFCFRLNLYDQPGPLKIHTRLVPRLGGIAIAVALVAGVLSVRASSSISVGYLLGAMILVWLIGLIDDIRTLHPGMRLGAQVVAAALLWGGNWRLPFIGSDILSLCATCLFVVLFINAFNFLDGADGLAAGSAAVVAIGFIALPVSSHTLLGLTAAWSLLGACTGFLASNFPPANIYLGDSGSTLLGFSVAFLALDLEHAVTPLKFPLLFVLLAAAIPLVDAALAVIRRIRLRLSPFEGDRRHFYDLLLARGWSARSVALVCYLLTAGSVAAALITLRRDFTHALFATVMIVGGLLSAAVRLGSLSGIDDFHSKAATSKLRWRRQSHRPV